MTESRMANNPKPGSKIEELRRVCDARTRGKWNIDTQTGFGWWRDLPLEDHEFIAMAANNIDKILDVVAAAAALRDHWNAEHAHFACGGEAQLLESLAELENQPQAGAGVGGMNIAIPTMAELKRHEYERNWERIFGKRVRCPLCHKMTAIREIWSAGEIYACECCPKDKVRFM